MTRVASMRIALWASSVGNLGAALGFWLPTSLGQLVGLPLPATPLYDLAAFFIGLFVLVYGWLALQPKINRPWVIIATLGKIGFFLIAFISWLSGNLLGRGVALASLDLVFAAVFIWWLTDTDTSV